MPDAAPATRPLESASASQAVPFWEAFRFWLKLGFVSFGGPAGQIAVMHRELVDERRWVSERLFLRALNFCMILPGPEATQLAIYVGWRMHGFLGGTIAGVFFVLPSFFLLLLLSWISVAYGEVPLVRGLLYGVQPMVIAIVVDAVVRVGRRTLRHPLHVAFAVLAFIALALLHIPFPLVVGAAALAGWLLQRRLPLAGGTHGETSEPIGELQESARPSATRTLALLALFLVLWVLPLTALLAWRGWSDVLVQEFLFFTQAAFITFGGAYAVLTYIAEVTVSGYGWLTAEEMVRGLGLAESTPGPLIMVTEYVGFLGAYRQPGSSSPVLNGTLGALATVYATFLPCFLFIFVGAPYVEQLAHSRRLQAALAAVTAAVVGVIANLGVYFGSRVLFPAGQSFDGLAAVLSIVALAALRRFHIPTYWLVPGGALAGAAGLLLGNR